MLVCFRRIHLGHIQVEELLHSLLDQLPERPLKAQGYGPANLVTLLHSAKLSNYYLAFREDLLPQTVRRVHVA